jgi:hypothetical protein
MPLVEIDLPGLEPRIPGTVARFLSEADRRIDEYQLRTRTPAFVASDFEGAYRVLEAVATNSLARGTRLCEWGSGFGVVASLGSFLGYESCGIEIEGELVIEARRLADDFDLDVELVRGSFVPRGAEARVCTAGNYAWLTTDGDDAYDELGLDPDDMDVIFAYPWPDEEEVTGTLFERYAGDGAVLATFHGASDFRLRRKVPKRSRRR